MSAAPTFLVLIALAFSALGAETFSSLKFKANFDSVYSFEHRRSASTPQQNFSEHCSCKIVVRATDRPDELIVLLKDPYQDYQVVPLTEEQVQQLANPFKVRLLGSGELGGIVTFANESIRALTIKNQVVSTILLDKLRYLEFANSTKSQQVSEWDLTKLPLGVCNATVTVTETPVLYQIGVKAVPADCKQVNLGGGQLTQDTKFELFSTFEKDGFTLEERHEDTNVTMVAKNGNSRGQVGYQYNVTFVDFIAQENLNIAEIKEEHTLAELQELNLY